MLPRSRTVVIQGAAALTAKDHSPEIAWQIPLARQPFVAEALLANLFNFPAVYQSVVVPMLGCAERTLGGNDGMATNLKYPAASSGEARHRLTPPFGEQPG